ncbi:MAG: sugar transferase [Candidatus Binatia bacterium]|nr:sugar transferase [Candidatus Binatia bacterium]
MTQVGRILGKASLDELPQLWNVVLGEMSLVGPHPLPVRDVDRIDVRWHRRRFSVKPSLTTLWQVRSRTPQFDACLGSDMEYVDNRPFGLDLQILPQKTPAVRSGHDAH